MRSDLLKTIKKTHGNGLKSHEPDVEDAIVAKLPPVITRNAEVSSLSGTARMHADKRETAFVFRQSHSRLKGILARVSPIVSPVCLRAVQPRELVVRVGRILHVGLITTRPPSVRHGCALRPKLL